MAEAPPAELGRRHRQWKERDEARPLLLRNVDDLIDMSLVALWQRRRVHIAPAGVEVAMRAVAAGAVMPEPPRILGILEAPYIEALVVPRARRAAPAVRNALHRGDHLPVGD